MKDFNAAPPRPIVLYSLLRQTSSAGYDAIRRFHRLLYRLDCLCLAYYTACYSPTGPPTTPLTTTGPPTIPPGLSGATRASPTVRCSLCRARYARVLIVVLCDTTMSHNSKNPHWSRWTMGILCVGVMYWNYCCPVKKRKYFYYNAPVIPKCRN